MGRRRKVVVRQVGQLVANDLHNHYYTRGPAPPDDHAMSRTCPQCGRRTWRHSGRCMHCQLDLRAWGVRMQLLALQGWMRRVLRLA